MKSKFINLVLAGALTAVVYPIPAMAQDSTTKRVNYATTQAGDKTLYGGEIYLESKHMDTILYGDKELDLFELKKNTNLVVICEFQGRSNIKLSIPYLEYEKAIGNPATKHIAYDENNIQFAVSQAVLEEDSAEIAKLFDDYVIAMRKAREAATPERQQRNLTAVLVPVGVVAVVVAGAETATFASRRKKQGNSDTGLFEEQPK